MTRSELRENMLVALDTLRARKVRSMLTILGIVIGVTSVIAVAAIIDGLNGFMINRIKSFGSRSLFITRIPAGYTGGRLPHRIMMRKYLEIGDARYLQDTVPGLDIATAFLQRIDIGATTDSIRYADEHVERLIIRGCAARLRRRHGAVYRGHGALHFASTTKNTRATWWSSARPSPTRCSRTPTRSVRRCVWMASCTK